MIILIPMGGKGERFVNAGYKLNKACIETTDRHSGAKYPMIVCAMKDIPGSDDSENTIVCVNRKLHQTNGTEDTILKQYPNTIFIHDHVMLDQAFGCFLAREYLNSEEDLFIGACDSGMDIDLESFDQLKESSDAIMISQSNCSSTLMNPEAHSWAILDSNSSGIQKISLKKTISSNPSKDHATTGMFWFKNSNTFLNYLEEMIWKKDMLDGKYYIDKVLQYYIDDQKKVNFIDVNYISWGTPVDFENYEKTLSYWSKFYMEENWNPRT